MGLPSGVCCSRISQNRSHRLQAASVCLSLFSPKSCVPDRNNKTSLWWLVNVQQPRRPTHLELSNTHAHLSERSPSVAELRRTTTPTHLPQPKDNDGHLNFVFFLQGCFEFFRIRTSFAVESHFSGESPLIKSLVKDVLHQTFLSEAHVSGALLELQVHDESVERRPCSSY